MEFCLSYCKNLTTDKVNSGRRSRDFPYVGAQPSGTELAQRGETEPTMRRPKEVDFSDEYVV